MMSTKVRVDRSLCLTTCVLLLGLALAAGPALAQTCTEDDRQAFAQLVTDNPDVSEEELDAAFGHCRDNGTTLPQALRQSLGDEPSGIKIVTNTGSVFYERLNSCGYHPQAEMVSCDVELRQRFGFGGFPGGTNEHVLFCFDCNRDGFFEFITRGFVHVTDDVSGATPGYFFQAHSTTFDAPAQCTANNGGATNVRAILSWFTQPANCFSRPIWGNQIDFTARRDP